MFRIFEKTFRKQPKNPMTPIYKLFIFLAIWWIATPISAFQIQQDTLQYTTDYQPIASDSIFRQYLIGQGYNLTCENHLKLLRSGQEKFDCLFQEIDKAQHHIHLEYFNFRNDSIGKVLFTHLVKKAKEGVKVRVLFDDFGNLSNDRPLRIRHMDDLHARGIEIIRFDPFKFPYINHMLHRDHQKIAVIDGKVGLVGGMNVADYYIEGLPEIGKWRDMHVRIEGPAVNDLQKAFLYNWNKESGEHIGNEVCYYPTTETDSLQTRHCDQAVAIVQRIPRKAPASIRDAYVSAINAAQKNIQIINPYFVPTRSIQKALKQAVQRGVKVEIMYPNKSDIPFTPHAGFYYANKMRKAGADVYLFQEGFHHSKIMMIDSCFCTIGSCNLDSRSLRFDYETNAFIFDPGITHQLNRIFDRDKHYSTLYTDEVHAKRSVWKRMAGWFAHWFTPFL